MDITGEKFLIYDRVPVYVGVMDAFRAEFEFGEASEYEGLNAKWLHDIYSIILEYL